MAEKALNLQKQIRENAQDLGNFLSDLNKWEKDIKKNDEDLKRSAQIEQNTLTQGIGNNADSQNALSTGVHADHEITDAEQLAEAEQQTMVGNDLVAAHRVDSQHTGSTTTDVTSKILEVDLLTGAEQQVMVDNDLVLGNMADTQNAFSADVHAKYQITNIDVMTAAEQQAMINNNLVVVGDSEKSVSSGAHVSHETTVVDLTEEDEQPVDCEGLQNAAHVECDLAEVVLSAKGEQQEMVENALVVGNLQGTYSHSKHSIADAEVANSRNSSSSDCESDESSESCCDWQSNFVWGWQEERRRKKNYYNRHSDYIRNKRRRKDFYKEWSDILLEDVAVPIRKGKAKQKTKVKKEKHVKFQENKDTKQPSKAESKTSRISSYDYDALSRFDVEAACQDAEEKEVQDDSETESEEENEDDSEASLEAEAQRRLQRSLFEKDKGNDLYKDGKYEAAINRYTIAADLDPRSAVIFANRAMALIKVERYAAAESDCTRALTLDPEYTKAVARRATARTKLKKYKEAREDQMFLLKLQPNNKQAKADIKKLDKEVVKLEASIQQKSIQPRRSKKPLKRIIIEEVGSDDEERSHDPEGQRPKLIEQLPEKRTNATEVLLMTASDKKALEMRNDGEKASTNIAKTRTTEKRTEFTVPDTAVQFETELKKVKKDPDEFYRYLSIIPPNLYRSLFHHSIDEVLPRALETFHIYYLQDKKEYWTELSNLVLVPRFDMALMFLSKASKNVVAVLFNELVKSSSTKDIDEQSIFALAKKYGYKMDKC